jgi:3-dehydro-L-gulonate 2-dehydrogenase
LEKERPALRSKGPGCALQVRHKAQHKASPGFSLPSLLQRRLCKQMRSCLCSYLYIYLHLFNQSVFMVVSFQEMQSEFKRILLRLSFTEEKASICARLFAENSRDGVNSHGLNRFPFFVQNIKDGVVDINANTECISANGSIEHWDGHFGIGLYNASMCMNRAITLAKETGLGLVTIKNNNHWMRGGTYGWQAADEGCIGICTTNTIANMPPWGGIDPTLGNNPIVIAVPRNNKEHVVLDMAVSQYSYGALHEHKLKEKELEVPGGYDEDGELSNNPSAIFKSRRALPIGFWKGSGLSLIIDVLLSSLTGGKTTKQITDDGQEKGVTQLFLCIYKQPLHDELCEEIIAYTKSSRPVKEGGKISYPGENTLATRKNNLLHGITVNEKIWKEVKVM